jgi:glycosidase
VVTSIFDPLVTRTILQAQAAARAKQHKQVTVDGVARSIPTPFPSPRDWRPCAIYFLLVDRFNNDTAPPRGTWNRPFDFRQGGTLRGIRAQLGYLERLGVQALWLSPILKNAKPESQYDYHGYASQDFLNLEARFASDGELASAERELTELIDEAHARGIRVIIDIVINHAARVFDYVRPEGVVAEFTDPAVMAGGVEPPVRWINGFGLPRADWQDRLDPPPQLSPDDAVWPSDLQNHLFFRRRGAVLDQAPGDSFVRGDFGTMRQFVLEYDARPPSQEQLRTRYGAFPVLNILILSLVYLMARYDIDGFRIDTVKFVDPLAIRSFGNAIREYALSIGKENFLTFGEIWDSEETIARFVGRNPHEGEGFGIDAALDYPLFYKLPGIAKGMGDVSELRNVFTHRKEQQADRLSSHGEAGQFFVTFLDNHDQHERIKHPATPERQVTTALGLLFTLQGIPCVYYGTEQGLQGTVDENGAPDLTKNESVREAIWGRAQAFNTSSAPYSVIQALATLRKSEPALSFGRLYFREVAGSGDDFGHSFGAGGLVAFSRILANREILVVANTGSRTFAGSVIVDRDLGATSPRMSVAFSNIGTVGAGDVRQIANARFFADGGVTQGPAAALGVTLAGGEIQILTPS